MKIYKILRKIILKINIFLKKKQGLKVGKNVSFTGFPNFGSEPYLIEIGNNVTFSGSVYFINHDGGKRVTDRLLPPFNTSKNIKFGKIKVGNNVFVGLNSILMPGSVIGDNVVVAAGSIVLGNLESNSVYGGTPAKKIMSINDYATKNLKYHNFVDANDYLAYRKNKKKYLISLLKDNDKDE